MSSVYSKACVGIFFLLVAERMIQVGKAVIPKNCGSEVRILGKKTNKKPKHFDDAAKTMA